MPRKAKPKQKRKTPPVTWSRKRYLALVLLSLTVGLGIYLGYLNHLINSRFEGDTWALPSRVFARAQELYPGLVLTREQLAYELELSSFLQVQSEPLPGQYRQLGASLELHARAFDFGDQLQPARLIQVFFRDGQVSALIDSVNSSNLSLFRLPPVILGSYYPDNDEDRLLLSENEVPERLINALIAVEDRAFLEHYGLSLPAILRAIKVNLEAGKALQGGSTLTQQLAKNLFLTPEKSFLRKFNEAFMALILEVRFSKQTIITAYVNEVFLLQQKRISIHGFAQASRILFRRSVDSLEPQQLALLVGMVKGPSRYNPFSAPERALTRRNLVLKIMFEQGLLSAAEFTAAQNAPLGIVEHLPDVNPFPAYLDLVKRQLQSSYSSSELARRGLRVFTAFDPLLQRNLEIGLARGLQRFDQPELQAAVVIADYLNGDIQALVGDRVTDFPGFNRALMAQRPIGSLIKPLLLYSLLEDGLTLASKVSDTPISIQQSNGEIWQPGNYDRELHGDMSLYKAFIHSYNLPFVRLGVEGGLESLAQNLARINLLKHDVVYPSMLLGTTAMSAYEVTQMFQVIAGNGYFTPLTTIRSVADQDNHTLDRTPLESHKLFDQASMIQVQRAMIGVSESGTARYLAERFDGRVLAAKTGTTNDLRDSWFAGFSDRLLAVVWMGRDDNGPINLTGSSGALRVWSDIMELQQIEAFKISRDDSLSWRYINPDSGRIAQQACANSVLLPFPRDRIPAAGSRCQ
jgi:penicillin-binding protein 1B